MAVERDLLFLDIYFFDVLNSDILFRTRAQCTVINVRQKYNEIKNFPTTHIDFFLADSYSARRNKPLSGFNNKKR